MPNGKIGDHPLTDMLLHGLHPFPADIERLIRRLHAIDPALLEAFSRDMLDWEAGRDLEQARERLQALLTSRDD